MKRLLFCCILLFMISCGTSNEQNVFDDWNEVVIEKELNWEKIDDTRQNRSPSSRLKVPGGWIVRSETGAYDGGIHQIFIADSLHEWRIK